MAKKHHLSFDKKIALYYFLLNNPNATYVRLIEFNVNKDTIYQYRKKLAKGRLNLKFILTGTPGTSFYKEAKRSYGKRNKLAQLKKRESRKFKPINPRILSDAPIKVLLTIANLAHKYESIIIEQILSNQGYSIPKSKIDEFLEA